MSDACTAVAIVRRATLECAVPRLWPLTLQIRDWACYQLIRPLFKEECHICLPVVSFLVA